MSKATDDGHGCDQLGHNGCLIVVKMLSKVAQLIKY